MTLKESRSSQRFYPYRLGWKSEEWFFLGWVGHLKKVHSGMLRSMSSLEELVTFQEPVLHPQVIGLSPPHWTRELCSSGCCPKPEEIGPVKAVRTFSWRWTNCQI